MSLLSNIVSKGTSVRNNVNRFWKFPAISGKYNVFGNITAYLSKSLINPLDRRLYVTGRTAGYSIGVGDGGQNASSAAFTAFEPVSLIDPNNPWEPGETIEDVYLSRDSAYYTTNLGNLYAIGRNDYGQLGIGNLTDQKLWRKVTTFNKNVVKFVCVTGNTGYCTCLALLNTGKVWGWGYNVQANLGIPNDTTNKSTPVSLEYGTINGKTITDIYMSNGDAQYNVAFVIDSNRYAYGAGYNLTGMVGASWTNNTTNTTTGWLPLSSPTGSHLQCDEIICWNDGGTGAGFYHDKVAKVVYAGGYNAEGQLGDGTVNNRYSGLVAVTAGSSGSPIQKLYTGMAFPRMVAGVREDGTMRLWGRNNQGNLGTDTGGNNIVSPAYNPNTAPSSLSLALTSTPVKVLLLGNGIPSHTIFLTSNGLCYGAGYNGYGQLAQGDVTARSVFNLMPHPTNKKFIDIGEGGSSAESVIVGVDEDYEIWTVGSGYLYANAYGNRSSHDHCVWRKAMIKE